MYLSKLSISNFRCFDASGVEIELRPGLTAFVGENDAGKSAIVDAIRYVLGTTDQEWIRVSDSDFHNEDTKQKIKITCRFDDLTLTERGAFLEYLTYENRGDSKKTETLYVNWEAVEVNTDTLTGRVFIKTEVRSGKQSDGPTFQQEVRELLRATYLRPLRDAGSTLSAGKNSRLSQVLRNVDSIKKGVDEYTSGANPEDLSIAGVAHLANHLLDKHNGIAEARGQIDKGLQEKLLLAQDKLHSKIAVSGFADSVDRRRQLMLEKLNLDIERTTNNKGSLGLGTNNVLYMACELLLLEQAKSGNRMLLIEEPEAHLHAQRQLKVMKSLQAEARDNGVQVLVSTHSPQLASAIKVENLVIVQSGKCYSLSENYTKLSSLDYRFLDRFLDATKANLFFAKAVVVVEGDAESILLPTIARLLGRDFADYGVSVVNVGGTGLRRFSDIFQRKNPDQGIIDVPVACITDMDVMPDCAPEICIKSIISSNPGLWPDKADRQWRAMADFSKDKLVKKREELCDKCDGQRVKTFVADHWTLEYDLAHAGLGKEVYVAAKLAIKDGSDVPKTKTIKNVLDDAKKYYVDNLASMTDAELQASKIYAEFTTGTKASKSIAAQYLGCILEKLYAGKSHELGGKLPAYLKSAIEYVTGGSLGFETPDQTAVEGESSGEAK